MSRVLKVTGKGDFKVRPDMTRVAMTIEGVHKNYAHSLELCEKSTEELLAVVRGLGFERRDLKTVSFDIQVGYENYKDFDGEWKSRFKGYEFRHVMKIEFESDNHLLGRLLNGLAGIPTKPEFTISYFVKDNEGAKNKLLGRAVEDAKQKAEILASSAGVKLKQIQSIDYSWSEVRFERNLNNSDFSTGCTGFPVELDIEPDDIELSDTVTVVWEIE